MDLRDRDASLISPARRHDLLNPRSDDSLFSLLVSYRPLAQPLIAFANINANSRAYYTLYGSRIAASELLYKELWQTH